MKRLLPILLAAALAGCATRPVTRVDTRPVLVPVTERAVAPAQLPVPPAPLGPNPGDAVAALDLALAKLCEYVAYAETADLLLLHAAGLDPEARVEEPVCRR
ncbi:MAG: hypothetical protein ACFBQW_07200 [Sphingomonadaceae bacterium]